MVIYFYLKKLLMLPYIWSQDSDDNAECHIVFGNDIGRPRGKIQFDEREFRLKGLRLRDKLKLYLRDHYMYRPSKETWYQDENMY